MLSLLTMPQGHSATSGAPDAGPAPVNLRRLLILYLLAIFVILSGVFASLVVTQIESAGLARAAQAINVNGRQRMLTQRIVYLSHTLTMARQANGTVARSRADVYHRDLTRAVDQFEAGHVLLTGPGYLPAPQRALYFRTDAGPTLDRRVRSYIDAARTILDAPDAAGALTRLGSLERAGLLKDLDAVVGALEAASVEQTDWLRAIEAYSLILAVIVVMLEVVYIFVPGHRMIEETLQELEQRNSRLVDAQTALTVSLGALEEELAEQTRSTLAAPA